MQGVQHDEIEITVRGYAHNVGEPLGLELGSCTAHLLLTEDLATHVLTLRVDSPAHFLAFRGVEKRAVGMDDPRDIGFGLARLGIRRITQPLEAAAPLMLDLAAPELAVEGFHEREASGAWTAGPRCAIYSPRTLAGDLHIRLELFHLVHNDGREIELSVGGSRLAFALKAEQGVYEFDMSGVEPANFLRLDNIGCGPSGNEDDPRQLGLGIARFTITSKPASRAVRNPASRSERVRSAKRPGADSVLYTTILNPNDGRKNWEDIITAFVYALRDRPGATLLVKIANENLNMFFEDIFTFYMRLHPFKCRVVFIHGYLSDEEYQQLIVNSHFIVNASRGEGQCLPLMEYMSSGVPAIAPRNTAMLDYISVDNAFLVTTSPELTYWPHDPRQVFRTCWHRINWQTLYQAFVDSEAMCRESPGRYRQMADAAIASLQQFCSMDLARGRLREILARLQGGDGT